MMRLRFSIRDLFWLTLVVALITGWRVYQQRTRAQMVNDVIGKDQVIIDLRGRLADLQANLATEQYPPFIEARLEQQSGCCPLLSQRLRLPLTLACRVARLIGYDGGAIPRITVDGRAFAANSVLPR
jgi:hypothetical protein